MGKRRQVIVPRLLTRVPVRAEEEGSLFSAGKATVLTARPGWLPRGWLLRKSGSRDRLLRQKALLVLKGKVAAIAAVEEIVK